MRIFYWSDYACPFCYIGETRLKKALSYFPELEGTEVVMKAFELDPNAPDHYTDETCRLMAYKYGIPIGDAARQIESISDMGRSEGLEFNYKKARSTNTMDAHRLTKLAMSKNDPKLTERVTEALYKAYFADGMELADHATLIRLGSESGLETDEIKRMLDSDEFRDDVIADEKEAARFGIHAVPFFVAGRYYINGAQSVENMKSTIKRALEDMGEQEKMQGGTCGPDGCF